MKHLDIQRKIALQLNKEKSIGKSLAFHKRCIRTKVMTNTDRAWILSAWYSNFSGFCNIILLIYLINNLSDCLQKVTKVTHIKKRGNGFSSKLLSLNCVLWVLIFYGIIYHKKFLEENRFTV